MCRSTLLVSTGALESESALRQRDAQIPGWQPGRSRCLAGPELPPGRRQKQKGPMHDRPFSRQRQALPQYLVTRPICREKYHATSLISASVSGWAIGLISGFWRAPER